MSASFVDAAASACRRHAQILWIAIVVLLGPSRAHAYAALTHEAIVDSAWEGSIVPLLRKRFPGVAEEELRQARAYAYGGCVIQDLGFYPFGDLFFSDLVHYVRSGDFATILLEEAQPLEEYAFALGALEHYFADSIGHPRGVNRAVPLSDPGVREDYGDVVTWADDPLSHMKMEFAFDVLQVARGRYSAEAAHAFIGFKVATRLLERTVFKVYGLELQDVLTNVDLTIGTYRRTVSELIPEATKIAWEMNKEEYQRDASVRREQFVYDLPRSEYEREWGSEYERPDLFAKLIGWIVRPIPKIGALMDIDPPKPQVERLFFNSFAASLDAYRKAIMQLGRGGVKLPNLNLDTGRRTRAGDYPVADSTYAELVERLSKRSFATVTPELRKHVVAFYGKPLIPRRSADPEWQELIDRVAALQESAITKRDNALLDGGAGRPSQ